MISTIKNNLSLKMMLPVLSVAVITIMFVWVWIPKSVVDNAVISATKNAQRTVVQFKTLRKYYTENVVKKINAKKSMAIDFDHKDHESTIPLPATMIHDLSAELEKQGTSIKLYSIYPFPNRADRKLDEFSVDAWSTLSTNPTAIITQKTVDASGQHILRVAIADTMVAPACVNCHNSHPLTPKIGWKIGDVRGVLEVEVPIAEEIEVGNAMAQQIVFVFISLLSFAMLALYIAFRRSVKFPIDQALAASEAISRGIYDTQFTITSNDDAAKMLKGIDSMQNTIKSSLNKLEESNNEYTRIKQALDNSKTGFTVSDEHNQIIYVNESAKHLFESTGMFNNADFEELIDRSIQQFERQRTHDNHQTTVELSGKMINLMVNSVTNDNNQQLGTIIQWTDCTSEFAIESELDYLVDSANKGDLTQRITMQGKSGFYLKLSEGLNELMESSYLFSNDMGDVFYNMAKGNLNYTIKNNYAGQLGKIKDNANESIKKLSTVMEDIMQVSKEVGNAANELSTSSSQISKRTESQAYSLKETATRMEEINTIVTQSTKCSNEANDMSVKTMEVATTGLSTVNEADEAMNEISKSSNHINAIIGVIDEIAFQTNLLALNAAVEAARAGDKGRGFAVVASEVGRLSKRSATAAQEIKILIRDSITKVDSGSALVDESGKKLKQIVNAVEKVAEIIQQVKNLAKEQSLGINQINTSILHLQNTTQQNATFAEETSASAQAMNDQAANLNQLVSFFRT